MITTLLLTTLGAVAVSVLSAITLYVGFLIVETRESLRIEVEFDNTASQAAYVQLYGRPLATVLRQALKELTVMFIVAISATVGSLVVTVNFVTNNAHLF